LVVIIANFCQIIFKRIVGPTWQI